jgi:hypothetical protein
MARFKYMPPPKAVNRLVNATPTIPDLIIELIEI